MGKGINVLSLFDGMSCGRLALQRAGIHVDNYYASEIDKHAIKVAQSNFPNTVQLGSVLSLEPKKLPRIDLLIGGSPCQGFSFAGKQLNFDDPRSKLFFDYVRILNEIREYNPNVKFLLENVRMKQEYQDVISEHLGVQPIKINSALLSAQNRQRLYWTNIPNVTLPEDKGIFLKDILESGDVDRTKSHCLDANYHKGGDLRQYFDKSRRQLVFERVGEANNKKPIFISGEMEPPYVFYETRSEAGKKARREARIATGRDTTPRDKDSKIYLPKMERKANCLVTVDSFMNWVLDENYRIRKLTPIECERLQTVPDNYTNFVSNSQRYRMLGNGWTVDVVAHIFKGLKPYDFIEADRIIHDKIASGEYKYCYNIENFKL